MKTFFDTDLNYLIIPSDDDLKQRQPFSQNIGGGSQTQLNEKIHRVSTCSHLPPKVVETSYFICLIFFFIGYLTGLQWIGGP